MDVGQELYQQVSNWMEIDTTGVNDEIYSYSQEDNKAIVLLESTTKRVKGLYKIGLMWQDDLKLPNNRIVAELQLRFLQQRLNKGPHLKNLYQETIDSDVAKQYTTEVYSESDTAVKAWFLPHQPATNNNKHQKVRRVAKTFLESSVDDKWTPDHVHVYKPHLRSNGFALCSLLCIDEIVLEITPTVIQNYNELSQRTST